MKKSLSTAMIVAALALTSACGGGEDRPSKGEVKTSITSKDSVFGTSIPEAAADCVAGLLVDSKLSDKTLNAIVEKDEDYKGSKEDREALTDVSKKFSECVTN
ncbi:hypothetical protein GEV29_09785 [Aeromicrobium sp. SMF47]|uniref:hypothetical protein n=1 Tax=Aeromicrobium TaxID=2040 RepID=UPI00129D62C4|nr:MULTISPECIES: hypothetical protein [Aeromicrobium]MRJ76827.1 hypothetical protein [Aeromicrobium yanjiei]MRK01171.1 hypothetical protein [Aeromicrobium sp. S22]